MMENISKGEKMQDKKSSDVKNNEEYIKKYLHEVKDICDTINVNEIDKMINILYDAWKNNKQVITMGNGGSAATASHFAGDLMKTVANDSSKTEITNVKGFRASCLNDNAAVFTAWVNDCGWENVYEGMLTSILNEGDVILLVSVHGGSGWSGNVVKAMELAKKRNAKIVGFAGFDGGKMKELGDACVVVPKNSTPLVEGFHGDLQHMIVDRLRELINKNN